MKRYLFILLLALSVSACGGKPEGDAILARVNNYEITRQEFEEEFKASPYGADDTLESRKVFLEHLTNRKLILQEAQAQDLDKKKSFLRLIEKFWEQSLLKISLDAKNQEIYDSLEVTDSEIEEIYEDMIADGKTDKTLEEMHDEIKWQIEKVKSLQLMSEWLEELHENADIEIDYDLLQGE